MTWLLHHTEFGDLSFLGRDGDDDVVLEWTRSFVLAALEDGGKALGYYLGVPPSTSAATPSVR